jgi:hypothetical protein
LTLARANLRLQGLVGFDDRSASLGGTESETMEVVDTLSFLLGTWTLERSITDHRAGTHGRFEGNATFAGEPSGNNAADGGRAHYDEVGTLRFGIHTGPASRSLEYVRLESAIVMLCFADGNPFVDLDLRSGSWRSVHHCRKDRYEIVTTVQSPSEVEERWRVKGPTKDYGAVAILRRVD